MENNNSNSNPVATTTVPATTYPPTQTPPPPSSVAAPPFHHLLQAQQQQLQMFWNYQRHEIEQVNDFKNHQLPLARIKKIMKADEDVRMISAEAPVLFAKACELFILELTIRSWLHAEENKRRTLQKNDIAAAITRTDIFDFLVDIVPRDEIKDEAGLGGVAMVGATASGVPYYYPPIGQPGGRPWILPEFMRSRRRRRGSRCGRRRRMMCRMGVEGAVARAISMARVKERLTCRQFAARREGKELSTAAVY